MRNRWKKKFPIFAQNPVLQSPSIPQGGVFKVFDARGRKIFLREYLKKLFGNDVRYVGSAPGRLFVMTYGTSVRRKRVNVLSITVTWYSYPCNSWIFFLPTAPSISLPGLGSKDGWEQALSHVGPWLTPLGSWLQIPHTRLSGRPPNLHKLILLFIPKVSIMSEQMMFLSC